MAFSRANKEMKAKPISRNGRAINQSIGHATTAKIANGQQSTNNMHQSKITVNVFIAAIWFLNHPFSIGLAIQPTNTSAQD
jgi:hypothetical protein